MAPKYNHVTGVDLNFFGGCSCSRSVFSRLTGCLGTLATKRKVNFGLGFTIVPLFAHLRCRRGLLFRNEAGHSSLDHRSFHCGWCLLLWHLWRHLWAAVFVQYVCDFIGLYGMASRYTSNGDNKSPDCSGSWYRQDQKHDHAGH